MACHCLPPIAADRPMSEHLEVLGALSSRFVRPVEGIGEAGSGHWRLFPTVTLVGHLEADQVKEGGRQVGDVVELVPPLPCSTYPAGPVDNQWVSDPSAVCRLFVPPHGGVACLCPAPRIIAV